VEFNVSCPECGNFVQIQKGDPVVCPKCGEVDIDTSPMDFGDTHKADLLEEKSLGKQLTIQP